jgi:hypothetical protein
MFFPVLIAIEYENYTYAASKYLLSLAKIYIHLSRI